MEIDNSGEEVAMCMLWLQVDFADTSVVITEPYFNFTSIQESMNEILFEEYQFQAALRINGEFNVLSIGLPQWPKACVFSISNYARSKISIFWSYTVTEW